MPGPWPMCPARAWSPWSAAVAANAEKLADEARTRLRRLRPTWTPCWRGQDVRRRHRHHAQRRAHGTGRRRGRGRQARRRREAAGNHRSSAATASSTPATEHGVKLCTIFPSRFGDANRALKKAVDAGPLRPADAGRNDVQMVAAAIVLRRGRLEGHPGARRRRRPDEPGHPQRRSAAVDDGPGDAHQRLHRHAGPRAHRGGRHGRRLSALRQRRARRHPGDDQRPSRVCRRPSPSTATRAPWSSSRTTCCAGTSTPETPEDKAIKERFAQKTGASGGSSNPAAISHVGHARQLADFVQAIQTNSRAAGRWPRRTQGGCSDRGDLSIGGDGTRR